MRQAFMKTKHWVGTLLAILLIIPWAALAAPVGKITNLAGNVDITIAGKAARNAATGDPVNIGDFVRTKSNSKVEITFTEGNILRLAENTRVGITQYMSGEKQNSSIFNLFRGKIQNIVKTVGIGGGRYEVHTPTSVCGVRGTHFFNFFLAGASGSIFQEGSGYGYSKNTPADVKTIAAGQGMFVAGATLGAQLRSVSNKQLDEMKNATEISGSSGDSGGTGSSGGSGFAGGLGGPNDAGGTGGSGTFGTSVIPAGTAFVIPPATCPSDNPNCQTPAPEPTPTPTPSNTLSASFNSTGIGFTNTIDSGTLTGTSTDNGATYTLTASGAVTGPATDPAGTTVQGTLSTGEAFSGYVMGLPGSWRAIMPSVYVTGTQAGFLVGPLSGTFTASTFSGTGLAVKYAPVAYTTIAPNALVLSNWTNISLPLIGDVFISAGNVSLLCSVATCESEVRGINVTGGKIGVGGAYSTGGVYSNTGSATFANQQYFSYDPVKKAARLSNNLAGAVDTAAKHVSIAGDFTYMDTLYKGVMTMNHFGVYSGEADQNYSSISGYTVQLAPLALANELSLSGATNGIAGSTQSIWTNSSVTFNAIGSFTALGTNFDIISGNWQSKNYTGSGNALTNDGGGAYRGFLNHQAIVLGSTNTVATNALALYVDTSGNTGILRGIGSGNLYLYSSGFDEQGTLIKNLMATGSSVDPTTFGASNVVTTTRAGALGGASSDLLGGPVSLPPDSAITTALKITGVNTWGIEQRNFSGTYTGSSPTGNFAFGYEFPATPGNSAPPSIGSESFIATPSAGYDDGTNGGYFRGSIAGATADWQSATTSVFGGILNGAYSSGESSTWNASALTTSIETAVFIAMVADTSAGGGRDKLAALNIPSVIVGSVNMSLAGPDAVWTSLNINNMGFYASTSGGKPQIWASNNVNGTAYTVPAVGNSSVLSGSAGGSAFTATFTLRKFDTGTNKWAADVGSSGTPGLIAPALNTAAKFQGGAAGTISGATITGTASGTAR